MQRLYDEIDEDALNEVLTSLRVRSSVYCRSTLRAPWGFAIRPRDACAFHLVSEGCCWLQVDDIDDPVRLETGDVVLLMTGRGHAVRDDPSSGVEWLDDILGQTPADHGQLTYGGSGATTELICGGFMIEGAQASPLLFALPPILRLEGRDEATAAWLLALLAMLHAEVARPRPGSDAVLARLADILVTQTIRSHLVSLVDADQPQVGALRDPRIAKAIRLAHSHPAHPWTVEEMAAEVAMSRSAFAATFRQLTGESPMRYVTRCRLAEAASRLGQPGLSVLEVARASGYDSEASFSRAFARHFGMTPGGYRRRLQKPALPNATHALPEISVNGDEPPRSWSSNLGPAR